MSAGSRRRGASHPLHTGEIHVGTPLRHDGRPRRELKPLREECMDLTAFFVKSLFRRERD